MGRLIKFAAVAGLALLFSVNVCAVTLHVPSEYATIQAGIDAAVDGDTVLVAPGTYVGIRNRDLSFTGKSIVVMSSGGALATTIDCGGSSAERHRAFKMDNSEPTGAVIDGFTISGGYAPTDYLGGNSAGGAILVTNNGSPSIRNCIFTGNHADRYGGAITIDSSSPIVTSCQFGSNNSDYGGGGVFTHNNSTPRFEACYFDTNYAEHGSAIWDNESSSEFTACSVTRNHGGTAVFCSRGLSLFDSCVLEGNWTDNSSAMAFSQDCSSEVSNCIIRFNSGSGEFGSAINYNDGGDHILLESIIYRNNGPLGSAINVHNPPTSLEITGCTIALNEGGIKSDYDISLLVERSIIAFSRQHSAVSGTGASIFCSDFYGNYGGDWVGDIVTQADINGNFSNDPLFCDTALQDFSIAANSPCVELNNPCEALVGAVGVGCANYLGTVWNVSPLGNDTTGDGSLEYPFATIQHAVDHAADGDTVMLQPGVYTGDGNRDIWIDGELVYILSTAGKDSTVIDAGGEEHDGFSLFGLNAIISGITIQNARWGINGHSGLLLARDIRVCNASDKGIYVYGVNAEIDSCIFDSCYMGVSAQLGRGSELVSTRIVHTVFTACNYAVYGRSSGAVIAIDSSSFENNTFGFATYEYNAEGCFLFSFCDFDLNDVAIAGIGTFTNCDISNNRVGFKISASDYPSTAVFDACTISGNTDTAGVLLGYYTYFKMQATLTDCIVTDNGGGIYCTAGYPGEPANNRLILQNTLCARNAGPIVLGEVLGGAASKILNSTICDSDYGVSLGSTPTPHCIDSSIVCNNLGYGISNYDEDVLISCSNVYGNDSGNYQYIPDQTGINGNISVDPLFCDPAAGDYTIMDVSPCAPANNTCGALMGAFDIGCSGTPTMLAFDLAVDDSSHVINHVPVFSWQYYTPVGAGQDSVEVAVGVDTSWTHAELWNPAPFATGDTSMIYGGLPLVDGQDCYVRLRVHNGYVWSEWLNASFHMNSIPTIPSPLSPDSLSQTGSSPDLWLVNASDAESDLLRYDFQVALDSDFISLVAVGNDVLQTEDSTSWLVSSALDENRTHYWRARTFDGYEYSDWSAYASFVVNAFPEAPSAPMCVYPPVTEDEVLFEMMPVFTWSASIDDDPDDTVRYRLTLAVDESFTFATTVDSIATPSYQFPDSLDFEEQYWWKVEAYDKSGLTVQSSNELSFWTWTLGDVTHSHAVDISDLTYLVNYLFLNGDDIVPAFVGDFNGSCGIDISDLTLLVNYLFLEGPPPRVGCMPSRLGPSTETATVSSKEN